MFVFGFGVSWATNTGGPLLGNWLQWTKKYPGQDKPAGA
jgi:hypothetical protein